MSKKRAAGGGRSKLSGTPLSRLNFPCRVASCNASFRSDRLKDHYINCVQFDDEGSPINIETEEFQKLNDKKKEHTRFFARNGYSLQKLPNPGKPIVPENSVLGYFTQEGDRDNDDRDVPAEKRPRLKETDVVFDGISDSDESGKSNGSEDEIARDDEGKESVDNDGKDSVDNNSEGSDDEEFQIRLNALFGQGDNELPTAGSVHAETTEDNSEEIQSQRLSLCDSGDVAQD